MRKLILIFLMLLNSPIFIYAQYNIRIDARVLDESTKVPIPYVNIGFIGKGIGTVADEKGTFMLKYDESLINNTDILKFSVLGYEPLELEVSKLFDLLESTNKIYLKSKPIGLEVIKLTTAARYEDEIGALETTPGWRGEISLGGEIATRLKINNKNTKLEELQIKVLRNLSDSVKVRINIYDYNKKSPKDNLLNSNIYHNILINKGVETINLKPYNIILNDDIFVSIEPVEFFGTKSDLVIGARSIRGTSFLRDVSQNSWKLRRGVEMNYQLLVSYQKKQNLNIDKRNNPTKISLFWDASKSMKQNRDLKKDLNFISNYLEIIDSVTVEVIIFNAIEVYHDSFIITKGDANELIMYLEKTNFDGGTDYSYLKPIKGSDIALLFSDGIATLSDFKIDSNIPFFCISSNSNKNDLDLQNLSYYSNGHYINLKKNTVRRGLDFILNYIEDNEIYDNNISHDKTKDFLYGKVYDTLGPVQGAKITLKGSFLEVKTNAEGFYSIPVKYNDVIKISRLGMKTKEIIVPRERSLDIKLDYDGILLDVVELKKYEKNKDFDLNTPNSSKISNSLIRSSDLYMADLLRRVPGVKVTIPSGSRESATYSLLRNISPITPLFLVNGGPVNDINNIDPQLVEDIVVLKSLAETSIYGAQGAGGVIKITLKGKVNRDSALKINNAIIRGNDYDESNIIPLINNSKRTTRDINGLFNSTELDIAMSLYNDVNRKNKINSIPFYVEASDHFFKWDKQKAYVILSSIADLAYDNPKALKTLAYKLEEMGKLKHAKHIYKRIIQLRPRDAQPYRDLAHIYQETGEYKEASNLYKRMIANSIKGLDFSGMKNIIYSDLKQLLTFHRSKIDYKDFPKELLTVSSEKNIRLVFEWNDSNTEFIFQFVNPNNKYFTWNHVLDLNGERILSEIETGFHSKEFIIDQSSPKGEWIINTKFMSEESGFNPTFLKYTVYNNYGLNSQTKKVKVLKLYNQKQKVTIDKLLFN